MDDLTHAAGTRRLYRLTGARHAGDLSGKGARLHPGRWNRRGEAVIYTSTSRALALAEVTMHIARHQIPFDLSWTILEVPQAWWASAVCHAGEVPLDLRESRAFGAAWRAHQASPLLKVPSATFADSAGLADACDWNVVIHAEHPDVQRELRCVEVRPFAVDARFWSGAAGAWDV